MKKTLRLFILNTTAILFILLLASNSYSVTLLPLNTETTDTMATGETVVYEFTVQNPGEITISLSGWINTLNWSLDYDRMYIYNSQNEAIERNAQSYENDPFIAHMMGNPDSTVTRVGESGTYYLHLHSGQPYLWPEGINSQSYSIKITYNEIWDTNEINDSMESATEVTIGETVTAYQWKNISNANVFGDEDWYKITMPSPGTMTVTYSGWKSTYNWGLDYDRLYVYTSDGTMFSSDGEETYFSHMIGETGSIDINISSGGEYYLRFHAGAAFQTTPYLMSVSFDAADDQFETNDTKETAALLESGKTYTAYQWKSLAQGPYIYGDEDYYTFSMTEDGTVTIDIVGWISIYNWGLDYDRLFLYKPDNEAENGLAEVYTTHMLGDNYSYTTEIPAGNYILRLHGGSGVSGEGYTITVNYPVTANAVASEAPTEFRVYSPTPNPFNPSTVIAYDLPSGSNVKLLIYDILGREIAVPMDEFQSAGHHQTLWNGKNSKGVLVGSGTYFFRITAGDMNATGKMTFLR